MNVSIVKFAFLFITFYNKIYLSFLSKYQVAH